MGNDVTLQYKDMFIKGRITPMPAGAIPDFEMLCGSFATSAASTPQSCLLAASVRIDVVILEEHWLMQRASC
jgi:hypothetical protein